MSWLRAIPAGLIIMCAAAMPAMAQVDPNPNGRPTQDCGNLDALRIGAPAGLIAGCAGQVINRQSLINTSTTIQDVVAGRLGPQPSSVEPAGLDLSPEDALKRLASYGPISIVPTADVAEPAPANKWNIWVDGKVSFLDNKDPLSDLDGELWNLLAGVDYKLTDSLVFGVLGSYEASNLDGSGPVPPSQDTEGFGGGVYMGLNVTQNIVFSANVLGSAIDTDVESIATTRFESERVQASASLTGYWYSGTIRFSPMVSIDWSKEWQEDKAGVLADQTIETAILTPGLQIGNTFALSDTSTMEPWLGAMLDWTFVNETHDDLLGKIVDDTSVDLRLQAGLNFALGSAAQLALTGEVSGLLLKEQDTYTAEANLAFQF